MHLNAHNLFVHESHQKGSQAVRLYSQAKVLNPEHSMRFDEPPITNMRTMCHLMSHQRLPLGSMMWHSPQNRRAFTQPRSTGHNALLSCPCFHYQNTKPSLCIVLLITFSRTPPQCPNHIRHTNTPHTAYSTFRLHSGCNAPGACFAQTFNPDRRCSLHMH